MQLAAAPLQLLRGLRCLTPRRRRLQRWTSQRQVLRRRSRGESIQCSDGRVDFLETPEEARAPALEDDEFFFQDIAGEALSLEPVASPVETIDTPTLTVKAQVGERASCAEPLAKRARVEKKVAGIEEYHYLSRFFEGPSRDTRLGSGSRYYGSAAAASAALRTDDGYLTKRGLREFCIVCHSAEHRVSDCPMRRCNICFDTGHDFWGCPKKSMHCGVCHRCGHLDADCLQEPLVAAARQLSLAKVRCVRCRAIGHAMCVRGQVIPAEAPLPREPAAPRSSGWWKSGESWTGSYHSWTDGATWQDASCTSGGGASVRPHKEAHASEADRYCGAGDVAPAWGADAWSADCWGGAHGVQADRKPDNSEPRSLRSRGTGAGRAPARSGRGGVFGRGRGYSSCSGRGSPVEGKMSSTDAHSTWKRSRDESSDEVANARSSKRRWTEKVERSQTKGANAGWKRLEDESSDEIAARSQKRRARSNGLDNVTEEISDSRSSVVARLQAQLAAQRGRNGSDISRTQLVGFASALARRFR